MRALTYSRVSTNDKGQKPEIQVDGLHKYCTARGWLIGAEIVDHGFSGGTDQRPGLKRLMTLVRARQADVIVVTKLDRFARSLRHLVAILDEFSELGILFVSVNDQIDLTTAGGRLMVHIIAAFAEFERALIRERTMAGLAYALSRGRKLGRPRKHDPKEILKLRASGMTYRAISKELGVPMGSITRAIKHAHKSPSKTDSENSIISWETND